MAELNVTKDMCNILDHLHGGFTATLGMYSFFGKYFEVMFCDNCHYS